MFIHSPSVIPTLLLLMILPLDLDEEHPMDAWDLVLDLVVWVLVLVLVLLDLVLPLLQHRHYRLLVGLS